MARLYRTGVLVEGLAHGCDERSGGRHVKVRVPGRSPLLCMFLSRRIDDAAIRDKITGGWRGWFVAKCNVDDPHDELIAEEWEHAPTSAAVRQLAEQYGWPNDADYEGPTDPPTI